MKIPRSEKKRGVLREAVGLERELRKAIQSAEVSEDNICKKVYFILLESDLNGIRYNFNCGYKKLERWCTSMKNSYIPQIGVLIK